MEQKNVDVRRAAAEAGVRLWEVAERLGTSDSNFSRKLRKELSEAEKDKIFDIIERLKKEAD
ncbi:MAG: hypothetical protein LUG64_06195 [Clostridiales bacterium]|nr:hypothetical protein [Clostridiales bacterium]